METITKNEFDSNLGSMAETCSKLLEMVEELEKKISLQDLKINKLQRNIIRARISKHLKESEND